MDTAILQYLLSYTFMPTENVPPVDNTAFQEGTTKKHLLEATLCQHNG